MKRVALWSGAAGTGLLALVLAGCPGGGGADAGKAGRGDASVPEGVVAEGTVMPAQYGAVGFPTGGLLREVLVAEGDHVEKGQLLARLDARELEARLQAARAELARTQANVKQVKAPVRQVELDVREAQLMQVRAELMAARNDTARAQRLKDTGAGTPAELDRALAVVARLEAQEATAQADIKLMQAGAREEAVAVAEAGVAAARAAVTQVEAALQLTELRAPFSGTVAWQEPRAGDFVGPGLPVVRLADTSHWVVKTEDLTELVVSRVSEGAPVFLTFDALPGVDLQGTVAAIRAFGERKKGDMTYTVTIEPRAQDPRLRWNMTASVRIAPRPDGGPVVEVKHLAH